MFKNYFILNRLVIELNKELQDYKIMRAFSFEKDKLILMLVRNKEELLLELSVNAGFPYINLRKKAFVPKKNFVDFFSSSLPLQINSVGIADNDRIVRIESDKASIYFAIRGKYTNVFCITDKDYVESFKKTDNKITVAFKDEVFGSGFISNFNKLKIEEDNLDLVLARKKYPVIGKEIINEVKIRDRNSTEKAPVDVVQNIISEIEKGSPAVFIDDNTNEVNLGIETFSIFSFTRKEKFKNITEAFSYFLTQKFSGKNISDKKKIIEKYLDRELNKISSKLNDTQTRIERGTKEEEYKRIANLLLININSITKGLSKIEFNDVYEETDSVSIKIDPKLSPRQNIDAYFNKARNELIRYERSKKLLPVLQEKYSRLMTIRKRFLNAKTKDDYNSIMKELKIKSPEKNKQNESIKNKFKQYLVEKKYNVFVGKDSKSNDLLTMKFARQNDYWFHARAVSGSHVVIKNENVKEGIPKNILKATASIAAYYSKAKTAGMVPVSYTQKKYVIKKKGMDPGKVALLREKVLIVKPEIPKGCEYVSPE